MKKNKKIEQSASSMGGVVTNELTQKITERSQRIFEGGDQLLNLAEKWKNVGTPQSQGHMFEQLEAVKFNMDALKKDSDLFAKTTASEGNFFDPVDIIIRNGKEKIVREVQAKSNSTAAKSAYELSNPKYGEMQRIAPHEQSVEILEKLDTQIKGNKLNSSDYIQAKKNFSDGLSHDGVSSGGTTRQESLKVTNTAEAEKIANSFKLESTIIDMHKSGLRGGAIYAAISAGISTITEFRNYSKGEIEFGEAITNVAIESAKGYATGYTVFAMSKAITNASTHFLGKNFSGVAQSSAPFAISAAIVNTSKSLCSYANGDIDSGQLVDEICYNAITSTSMFYYGAVGQTLIPIPVVGGMVGAGVGWFAAHILYQSAKIALGARQESRIAVERRKQIEAMCLIAIANIEIRRAELVEFMNTHFSKRKNQLMQAFEFMDLAMDDSNPDKYVEGLTKINECFCKTLPLKNFREFDKLMQSDEKLIF